MTMKHLCLLACLGLTLSAWAEETRVSGDSAAFLYGTVREDDEPGAGAAWTHALTESIAIYVGLDYVRTEDRSSYGDEFYSSSTTRKADGYEILLGYLHRVWDHPKGASLQVGPMLGLEQLEGTERNRYGGEFGSGEDRVEIDYDLGVNAYVQGLLRVPLAGSAELMVSAALGYRSAREVTYDGGGVIPLAESSDAARSSFPTYGNLEGAETFLRVALGVAIPF
jgi:hypothetical protein